MGNTFVNVDLVRLSQTALPIGKKYDSDKNGTLDEKEYKEFMSVWDKDHATQSPLLMQLHTKTLNENALKLALQCDKDEYQGVLTEAEIENFLKLCEEQKIQNPFKKGTSLQAVLTGDTSVTMSSNKAYKDNSNDILNNYQVKYSLFTNWLKLDLMSYKGSDKFFHAVGNYEAMSVGSESNVKKVLKGQDTDKRENAQRPEADYTEDLYANWLGREFYKMYPDKKPHDLFAPLAPTGFDIEKSKKSTASLIAENTKENDGWLGKKVKRYADFFRVKYIRERFFKEIGDVFTNKGE